MNGMNLSRRKSSICLNAFYWRKAAMTISPDGFFLETVDEERIYYNDENIRENYARVNMTILHETAHDVLGHTGMEECADKEETEAGFFAKYAAAPPPLVHRLPMVTMKVRAALASAGKVDKEISETLFRMILLKAQRLSMTLLGMAGLKSLWLTVKVSESL